MKRLLIAASLLMATAAHGETRTKTPLPQPPPPRSDVESLADKLFGYGSMREQQDRESFPKNMPKAGEAYDPVTGESIYPRTTLPRIEASPKEAR